MMVKRQKITALIFFVTGLILLGVFAAGNRGDYNSGVFCGFVCAECLLLVSMGVSTRIMNRKVF